MCFHLSSPSFYCMLCKAHISHKGLLPLLVACPCGLYDVPLATLPLITLSFTFLKSHPPRLSSRSLLIQLDSGIVLQMAVNGERLIACGTWACPEFFEAFQEAMQ